MLIVVPAQPGRGSTLAITASGKESKESGCNRNGSSFLS
jgi:hypothetical protein